MDTIEPLRKPFPVTKVPETPRMLHKLAALASLWKQARRCAQALNMLRRLDLDDLPDDAVEWELVGNCA